MLTVIPSSSNPIPIHKARTLDDLFAEAASLGRVSFFTNEYKEEYFVTIKFPTVAGITLEAESKFQPTLNAAFQFAIDRAHEIRKAFK